MGGPTPDEAPRFLETFPMLDESQRFDVDAVAYHTDSVLEGTDALIDQWQASGQPVPDNIAHARHAVAEAQALMERSPVLSGHVYRQVEFQMGFNIGDSAYRLPRPLFDQIREQRARRQQQ